VLHPSAKKWGVCGALFLQVEIRLKWLFFENNGLSAEFIRALTLQTIGMIHPSSDWQTEAA
jgi:hypothetical protein